MAYLDEDEGDETDSEQLAAEIRDVAMPVGIGPNGQPFGSAVNTARDRITKILNRQSQIDPSDVVVAALGSFGGRRRFEDELTKQRQLRGQGDARELAGASKLADLEARDAQAQATADYRGQQLDIQRQRLKLFEQKLSSDKSLQRIDVAMKALMGNKATPEQRAHVLAGLAGLPADASGQDMLAKMIPLVEEAMEKFPAPKADKFASSPMGIFNTATGEIATPAPKKEEKGKAVAIKVPGQPEPLGGREVNGVLYLEGPEGYVQAPTGSMKVGMNAVMDMTPAQRQEARKAVADMERGEALVDRIMERLQANPTAFGTWGDVRQLVSNIKGAASDVPGLGDLVSGGAAALKALGIDSKNDPTLDERDTLQMELIGLLSKALVGRGGRDLRAAYEEAKSIANLGGITGSQNIRNKLRQIRHEFSIRKGELTSSPEDNDPLGIRK